MGDVPRIYGSEIQNCLIRVMGSRQNWRIVLGGLAGALLGHLLYQHVILSAQGCLMPGLSWNS
jgi:hypothetical protein